MVSKDNLFLQNDMSEKKSYTIKLRGTLLDFHTPRIMGIVNLTPDSFYKASRINQNDHLMKYVEQMVRDGADFIDVGAISSRPGSIPVSEDEELERLVKPITALRSHFPETFISVDTFRSGVARKMVEDLGVDMINDISAGMLDEKMFETISLLQVPYIMMHMTGTPENMQKNPVYTNLMKDILYFFSKRLRKLHLFGVHDVIIDPGFGFGKTLDHNFEILANFDKFGLLGTPLMVGLSRKSMIYKFLGNSPEEALNGTTVAHTLALLKGADILRVHDVREALETIRMVEKIRKIDLAGMEFDN